MEAYLNETYEGDKPGDLDEEMSEELPEIEVPASYAKWQLRLTLLVLALLSGVGYLTSERMLTGTIKDAVFVSMLIGATAILLYGLKYLRNYLVNRGIRFYNFVLSTENPEEVYRQHRRLCSSVLNFRWMTVSGFLYGLAAASTPYLLSVWPENSLLLSSLSLFMFVINFTTGVAFYGLIAFFVHAFKLGQLIEVDIWRVNKPSTEFLLGATRRISILASIYAGLCNTSILFSVSPITPPVIGFFCFSGLTILASVVIPSLPIAGKLRRAKMEALNEIERRLHDKLKDSLRKAKESDEKANTEELESLLTVKEKIEAVHSWPFRIKSISAGLSVIFFTSTPLIVEYFLKAFFGS